MYRKLSEINFQDPNHIKQTVIGLTSCMQDENLPIKLEAALSLGNFLDNKEAKEVILPSL
jgi:hypothetical protein